jgi:hypothetical protein
VLATEPRLAGSTFSAIAMNEPERGDLRSVYNQPDRRYRLTYRQFWSFAQGSADACALQDDRTLTFHGLGSRTPVKMQST